MLSFSKLINALSANGIVHVGLEPPADASVAWWLHVNPADLDDPRATGNLSKWEA